ncbi:MFS transporter [Paraburkholderia sediminicola]|uniref:MFS transporter n=1 Tax=Paraburkholderia sediminicola TaxID=458836 RepID=UPI0038B9B1ED
MAPASRSLNTRAVVAAVIGNALEWYDFTVFGFLAVVIAQLFFPAGNDYSSMLLTTATFGVAFVMRPIGGIVLGLYADRAGRKAALSLVIALMTLGEVFRSHSRDVLCGLGAVIALTVTIYVLISYLPTFAVKQLKLPYAHSFYAVMLFGGFGPFVVTWLINTTGSPLAPTYYVMGGLALSIVAVACIPGKRHADLDARRKPA